MNSVRLEPTELILIDTRTTHVPSHRGRRHIRKIVAQGSNYAQVAWWVVRMPIMINFVGSIITECMLVGTFSCTKN